MVSSPWDLTPISRIQLPDRHLCAWGHHGWAIHDATVVPRTIGARSNEIRTLMIGVFHLLKCFGVTRQNLFDSKKEKKLLKNIICLINDATALKNQNQLCFCTICTWKRLNTKKWLPMKGSYLSRRCLYFSRQSYMSRLLLSTQPTTTVVPTTTLKSNKVTTTM
mgnify:CR=1 FL=1